MTTPDHQLDLPGARTAREILDEVEKTTRTNWANDGREFQKEIELTAGAYNARRIAYLRKVDPPVRIVWPFDPKQGRKVQRVIFQTNPFLDFVGVWTARGARALQIEAKSTASHRLAFNGDAGFKSSQWGAMKTWRNAGTACALLWRWAGRVVLFTPDQLLAVEASRAKSIRHEDGLPIPRGLGPVVWDFLPVLEAAIWPRVVEKVDSGRHTAESLKAGPWG